MSRRLVYFATALLSILVVATGFAISIFLVLLPTSVTLGAANWPEIIIGIALFNIHVLLIIAGVNAILSTENGRRMIVGLSEAALVVWFLNLVLFLLGMDSRPFIYQIAAYGWIGHLFLLWFYTRPAVKELFV
jgi:hypothetical protein